MIEIKVKQYNKAYNDEGTLDTEGTDINTVFQLSDVREPESRSTNYIKTFTLPGTKRNNRIFQDIYENGFQSFYFDPTKKIEAQVIVNGTQYFVGNLQVNKVNRLDSGYIDSYEVTIYGKVGTFFNDIKDLNLKDIVNLSEFNHVYTAANIIASWGLLTPNQFPFQTSPKPAGFIFQNGNKVPFQYGNGYVYPMIWRGQTDPVNWRTQDWNPAVYLKTYVDKIIKGAGYKYKSNFFNSEYFRKLIIPGDSMVDSNNGAANIELNNEQIKKYEFEVGFSGPDYAFYETDSTTGKNWPATKIYLNDDAQAPNNDAGNQYNGNTGVFTVGKTGQYKWETSLDLYLMFHPNPVIFSGEMRIIGAPSWEAEVYIQEEGNTQNVIASKKFKWSFGGDFNVWHDYAYWIKKKFTETVPLSFSGPLQAGKKYVILYKHSVPGGNYKFKTESDIGVNTPTNCQVDIYIKGSTTVNNLQVCPSKSIMAYTNKIILDGDTMDLSWFIPDMKAGDLINEINRLFNLYWLPIDDTTFLIEPREDFYASKSNIKDWSGKVDRKQTRTIQPLYDLNFKKYTYSYTSDDDYYNKDYEDNYKQVYSTKSVEIEADFITDESKYESRFAASPLIKQNNSDRHMTAFVAKENEKWIYQKPKTRILFYGGLKETNAFWYMVNPYTQKKTTINAEYPYAGHIDDPKNPTHDLSWGWPKKYYFTYQKATTNTLFNQFWLNNILEVTDINSHLLTITAVISDQDIASFDIRDIIQIDYVYYRVNKLTHNPVTGLAEIELFKARDTTPIKVTTTAGGTTGGTKPDWPTPKPTPTPTPGGGGWVIPGGNGGWTPGGKPWGGTTKDYWGVYQDDLGGNWGGTTATTGGGWNISPAGTNNINYADTSYPTSLNPLRGKAKQWGDVTPTQTYSDVANKDQNENYYAIQSNNIVNGSMNIVHPSANLVKVSGMSNAVLADTSNINIQGNNNVVMAGLSNVSIVGDNQVVTKSNYSYVNGVEIVAGNIARRVTLLKSPTNAVGNEYSNGDAVSRIIGGKNSTYAGRIVRGGQDTV